MANRKHTPLELARGAFIKRARRLVDKGYLFTEEFMKKPRTIEEYNELRGEKLRWEGRLAVNEEDDYVGDFAPLKPIAGSKSYKWLKKVEQEVEKSLENNQTIRAQELHDMLSNPIRTARAIQRRRYKEPLTYLDEETFEEKTLTFDTLPLREDIRKSRSWRNDIPEWGPEKRPEAWEFDYPFGEPTQTERGLRDSILHFGALEDRVMEGNYWENFFLRLPPEKREWWAQFIESNMDEEQIAISKYIRFPGEESWVKEEKQEEEPEPEGKRFDTRQKKVDNQFVNEGEINFFHNEDEDDTEDTMPEPEDDYDPSFDDVIWDRYRPKNWDEYDQTILEMLHAEYWIDFATNNEKGRLMDNLFKKALEKFGASKVADAYVKAKDKGAEYGAKIAGHYSIADSIDFVNAILEQIEGYDNDFAEEIDFISENAEEFEVPF